MEIEALKKIFQISSVRKQKELSMPSQEQKKRRSPKKKYEEGKGKVDIKV